MARHLKAVFEVEAVLTATVPIHVGNADKEMGQDAPVAVNGKGEPYIPGTSIAGPLRAWWREAFGNEVIWGRIEDKGDRGPDGYASLIAIEDATAVLHGALPELRDGVGIDRFTGAAAENIKYDLQILPAGTTFNLRIRLEVPADLVNQEVGSKADAEWFQAQLGTELLEGQILALLAALEKGDIRFGAAKTRGLGHVVASKIEFRRYDVSARAGILQRLKDAAPGKKATAGNWIELKNKAATVERRHRVTLVIHWSAATPVLNKSGQDGLTIDALPLTAARRGANGAERVPVITGASVKGVLRSHAERICRTIAGTQDIADNHLDHVSIPLVEALFGAPGRIKEKNSDKDKDKSRVGLGAIGIDDCLIGQPMSLSQWQDIVDARSDSADEAVRAAHRVVNGIAKGTAWEGTRISQHVGIDRWTGGAAEALLFNRLEPAPAQKQQFRLSLDLDRIFSDDPRATRQAAIILLLFVLRDFAAGKIPVGFGTNRGLGSIRVTGFEILDAGTVARDLGFVNKTYSADDLTQRDSPFLKGFQDANEAWKEFVRSVSSEVTG